MENIFQMLQNQFYKAMGWDPEWEKQAEGRLQAWMTALANGQTQPAEATGSRWTLGPTIDGWLKSIAEFVTITVPNWFSRSIPALVTTLGDGATQSVVDAFRTRQPDTTLANVPVSMQTAIHTAAADATDRAYSGFSRTMYLFYKDETQKVTQPRHTAQQVYQAVFDQTIISLINEKYGPGLDPKIAAELATQLRNNADVSRYASSVAAAYSGINPTGTANMGITTVWQPSGGDNIRYGAGVWQAMHENYGIPSKKPISLTIDTRGIESPAGALAVVGQVVDNARDRAKAAELAARLNITKPETIEVLTRLISEGRADPTNHADKFTPAEYEALLRLASSGDRQTIQAINGVLANHSALIKNIDLRAHGITFDTTSANLTMPTISWGASDPRPTISYPAR